MIAIQICGGLGNQFFSYARGFALAKDYNTDLVQDKYIYDTGYKWTYNLDQFNLSYRHIFFRWTPPKNEILIILYKTLSRIKRNLFFKVINEQKNYTFNPIFLNPEHDYYFAGYWQAHEYFDKYREEIKKEFTPISVRTEVLEFGRELTNKCAIHIRRGDYSSYKGGKILSIDYYKEAINTIRSFDRNVSFCVFSDDVEYCKKTFSDIDNLAFISIPDTTNVEEIYLMSKCKHFIIANSSFSWWGAYLGEKIGSIVICPVVDQWKESFYLDNWIKLPTEIG